MSISPRGRVSELIQQSVRRGIAVIVAAAGYGKTEAVRDTFGDDAHYLTVAGNTASPEQLARLIVTAIVPRRASGLAAILQQPQTDAGEQHLAAWVAAQLRTVEPPIVLDDFHHASDDQRSSAFVRHVIEHTAPRVRWAIVSRAEPRLPLASWLGRGWMEMPITQDDLEFDEAEAIELARAAESAIDRGALAELLRDTRGWPIALRLGLSAWERTRAIPQTRLRTRDLLYPFVDDEIWRRLSDEDRAFLSACALLPEPRVATLEAAGFAGARAKLPILHQRVPLVMRYGEEAFRLHDLFREFIMRTLRDDAAEREALVVRLAAALHAGGDAPGALQLHVDARDVPRVIALLRECGFALLDDGRRADVSAALAVVGAAATADPDMLGLSAYAQSLDGPGRGVEAQMQRALDAGAQGNARIEIQRRLARLLTNGGRAHEAIPLLEDAIASLLPESATSIEAGAALAGSYAVAGRYADAARAIAETASRSHTLDTAGRARVEQLLAFAAFYTEAYADAESFAASAAEAAAAAGLDRIAAIAYSILLAVADATSPYPDEMGLRSRQMERFAAAAGDRVLLEAALLRRVAHAAHVADDDAYADLSAALVRVGRRTTLSVPMPDRIARLEHDVGNGRISAAIAAWTLADAKTFSETERALRNAVLGFLYAAIKEDEKADEHLSKPPIASLGGDLFERRYLSYAIALRAAGFWLLDRMTLAKRALRYDERGLAEFDIILMNVISSICRSPRRTTTREQLVQLTEPLTAFGWHGWARTLRRAADVPETPMLLTPTELDILAELRMGGTAAEVADRLGRRKSTVDWHLKSIYRKIGCHGRVEAVSFAERMGWLPSGH